MSRPTNWVMFTLCFVVTGCATTDKYSFVRMGQTPTAGQVSDFTQVPNLSDALALNYASSVATILRCKFNGARIAREVSSTAQVALAALGGAGAAFNYGASTVTGLALGSAGIPQLQQIFDAKGRAQAYQDAVRLIEEAEIEYLAHNPRPSDMGLTPNGVTLFQRVTASIHVVEKTLAGNLPTVQDMRQATEQMTPIGALPYQAGDVPPNNISASAGIPLGKSELTQIVARQNKITVVLGGTPPPPNVTVSRIPESLQARNNALQSGFTNLTDSAASARLAENGISPGVNPKEVLAQNILAQAKLEPKAGLTAIQSLTQYRQGADTEAKTAALEDAYRHFKILPQPLPTDMRARNLRLKAAFEGLTDSEIQKGLADNGITPLPSQSAREALAARILKEAGLDPIANASSVASITTYRIRANFDLGLTTQLEEACRKLKLKGFHN
jgi:hypothetical protein